MSKNKRFRSPAYPAITLTQALIRAKELYKNEVGHWSHLTVAVSHWGYSEKSSGGLKAVAALKAYGLLWDKGAALEREVKLSDQALYIIHDEREDDSERNKLIAQCAKKPKVIADLLEKFPDSTVSDSNVEFYLKSSDFNPNAVSDILKVYRDALAHIENEGIDEGAEDGGEDGNEQESNDPPINSGEGFAKFMQEGLNSLGGTSNSSPDIEGEKIMKQDTFNIEEGQIVLQFPVGMSEDSFDLFTDWIMIQHKKIGQKADGNKKPRLERKDFGLFFI